MHTCTHTNTHTHIYPYAHAQKILMLALFALPFHEGGLLVHMFFMYFIIQLIPCCVLQIFVIPAGSFTLYTHTCMLLNFIPNVLNENFIVRKLLWKVLLVLWLTSLEKHCSNSHGATLFSIFLKCIWFMHKFVFFVFYMLSLIKTTVCCNMIDVTCHG